MSKTTLRRRQQREPVRARLQHWAGQPDRLDVVIEPDIGRFSVEQIDVVLTELLKVREVIV